MTAIASIVHRITGVFLFLGIGYLLWLLDLALDSEAGFGVGTGDGILAIARVQMEGKKAMSADEFLRGQRDLLGAVLPSS